MVDRAIIAEVRDFLLSLLTAQLRQLAAANASTAAAAAAAAGGGTFAVPSHDSFVSIAGIPRAVGRGRKRNSSTASSEGAGNSLSNSFRQIRIQICMDPHHFGNLDPHPHQSDKPDPGPDGSASICR
jgi:hypothetical protein